MPCLEISLPKIDVGTKEKLTHTLTEVFAESTISAHAFVHPSYQPWNETDVGRKVFYIIC